MSRKPPVNRGGRPVGRMPMLAVATLLILPASGFAQEGEGAEAAVTENGGSAGGAAAGDALDDAAAEGDSDALAAGEKKDAKVEVDGGVSFMPVEGKLSIFELIGRGGWLMIPIIFMAFLVGMFGIERGIALRKERIIPHQLVDGLGELGTGQGGFDPRRAYRLCQQYPSAASSVIRAMLLKVGRPHSEVESAVKEVSEREAARLYGNVRWLSLAAAVTPLLGLLGTVWGMIQAFFQTAHLPAGANKADALAEGIYVALVTTLGGLAIAIPAAILAHVFEGRIQNLFHQVEELLFNLLPQVERYEGRLRVTHQSLSGADETARQPRARPREEAAEAEPANA